MGIIKDIEKVENETVNRETKIFSIPIYTLPYVCKSNILYVYCFHGKQNLPPPIFQSAGAFDFCLNNIYNFQIKMGIIICVDGWLYYKKLKDRQKVNKKYQIISNYLLIANVTIIPYFLIISCHFPQYLTTRPFLDGIGNI